MCLKYLYIFKLVRSSSQFWSAFFLTYFSVKFLCILPLGRYDSRFCSGWHEVGLLPRNFSYALCSDNVLCFDLTQSTKSQDRKSESKEKQDILSFDKIKEQRERERQRQREREIRETERRRWVLLFYSKLWMMFGFTSLICILNRLQSSVVLALQHQHLNQFVTNLLVEQT